MKNIIHQMVSMSFIIILLELLWVNFLNGIVSICFWTILLKTNLLAKNNLKLFIFKVIAIFYFKFLSIFYTLQNTIIFISAL